MSFGNNKTPAQDMQDILQFLLTRIFAYLQQQML